MTVITILNQVTARERVVRQPYCAALAKSSVARRATRAAILALALSVVTGATAGPAGTYRRMALITDYLMDPAQEVALAKSAAPASISKDATVLVLTRTGYETAVTGTNGFVCWVARGFASATDWPERWNPKVRAAGCDNPQAARSMLPIAELRTAMTLAGHRDAEIMERIKAKLRSREIPPLEAGAMCFMMSKAAYLTDLGNHGMAHVMFYIPFKDGADWGANAAGSPIFGGNYWFSQPDQIAEAAALPPISVVLVGTPTWSDGSPAAMVAMQSQ